MATYRQTGGLDNIGPNDHPPCQHCGRFVAREGRYCAICRSAGVGQKAAEKAAEKAENERLAWAVMAVASWVVLSVPIGLICAGIGYAVGSLGGLLIGLGIAPVLGAVIVLALARYVGEA